MSLKSRGWIRIPIYSGTLLDEHHRELCRQAYTVAERCGAEVIKDCGERAELDDEVQPPTWNRFYLFKIQRLARGAR